MALSEKQKRFADEYLKTLNATDAYKKAGYKTKSESATRSAASRLLTNVNVSEFLQTRLQEHKLTDFMDQEAVLQRLSEIASGVPQEQVFKRFNKITNELEYDNVSQVTPEIQDQNAALQMLGKYYKLFVDKAEVELTVPTFVDDVPEEDNDADSQTTEN